MFLFGSEGGVLEVGILLLYRGYCIYERGTLVGIYIKAWCSWCVDALMGSNSI